LFTLVTADYMYMWEPDARKVILGVGMYV